eukprot:6298839-Amphidinium_carterae.1
MRAKCHWDVRTVSIGKPRGLRNVQGAPSSPTAGNSTAAGIWKRSLVTPMQMGEPACARMRHCLVGPKHVCALQGSIYLGSLMCKYRSETPGHRTPPRDVLLLEGTRHCHE